MKKKISLLMAAILTCSALAGTVSATPKKDVITMTVPSSYGYVYDRLTEAFPDYYDDYYYGVMPIEEVIPEEAEEEIIFEELVEEAPAMDMVAEAPAAEEIVVEEEAVVEEAAPQAGAGGDYSKTNVQVEGIDEGDIVKTDGEYIYVLKKSSGSLVVVRADGKNTTWRSRTTVTEKYKDYSLRHYNTMDDHGPLQTYCHEYARDLYVYGDYAAVIIDCSRNFVSRTNGINRYDDETCTLIRIYDVSDPDEPVKVATLGQSGNYETSRMIGGSIYLITDFHTSLNDRAEYEDYIPSLYHDGETELVPVKSLICPPEIHSRWFTVITEYSLTEQKTVSTKSVLTQSDTVYMNSEHLYITDERYYNDVLDEYRESVYTVTETVSGDRTDIFKFALGDTIKTRAFCTVDGRLLNQFSMDEYKGNLRLVTTHQTSSRKVYKDKEFGFTNTKWNSSEQTNGLYIYDENLNLLGSVTGLAADERVYSVRFTGDVGYFVTFRETDPLFAVDLSDPKAPKIMSALKIPGFSEYLHPYGNGLLFGLGQDATEQGRTTGVKLSMFDISDPYDVKEIHKKKLDISYTAALHNHKAILISAERGIIGFPSGDGYRLCGYDPAKGFYEIAKTEFKWDSNARGLYIGDMMYIVFPERTVVLDMKTYDIVKTVNY